MLNELKTSLSGISSSKGLLDQALFFVRKKQNVTLDNRKKNKFIKRILDSPLVLWIGSGKFSRDRERLLSLHWSQRVTVAFTTENFQKDSGSCFLRV